MNDPAFPTGIITDDKGRIVGGSNGMTLRDYFAAKAMQAILTRADSRFTTTLEFVSGKAYQYADVMLKERNGNS
jgi:hypothetical protein